MKFSRGLAALTLTLIFQTQLFAEYLYKDEVIFNSKFQEEIEKTGRELYEKTGITLSLIVLKELPQNQSIANYEKEILNNVTKPTVLLTFAELNTQVDILASEDSLYKYFNKKQVLSPVASTVQAYVMAILYARSWDEFNELRSNSGGTILPLLGDRAKEDEVIAKYSGSLFNGYLDIAEQIALSNGKTLDAGTGKSGENTIFVIKLFFYGFIFYGIIMYVKRKLYLRRQKLEQK